MKWYIYIWNILLCIGLFLLTFKFGLFGRTGHRPFLCKDPSLSLPIRPSIISNRIILSWGFLLPLILMFTTEFLRPQKINSLAETLKKSLKTTLHFIYYYFIDYTMLLVILGVVKTTTSSYRPVFFEMCKPDKLETCVPNTYVMDFKCTSNVEHIEGENKSFFSGHAMISAYTCTFCVIYLQFRFKRSANSCRKMFLLPFIQTILISMGLFGGISRILDHFHHPIDVVVGEIVGFLGAVHLAYTLYDELTERNQNMTKDGCDNKKEMLDLEDVNVKFLKE